MEGTLDVFKKFYSELTTAVPMIISDLVTKLYSDKRLSNNHKDAIDSLAKGKQKTKYLLDEVIKPGLEIGYTKLFDEMLREMKSSDEPTVNYLANKIFDQTQDTQSKGNYFMIHV